MVTVGRGILAEAVFEFFEGMRTFDAERAAAVLAQDAQLDTPWTGVVAGRDKAQEALATFLDDPEKRPSMTIRDITGDGAITHLVLSVSGRFGRRPERFRMSFLSLKGEVRQVVVRPEP